MWANHKCGEILCFRSCFSFFLFLRSQTRFSNRRVTKKYAGKKEFSVKLLFSFCGGHHRNLLSWLSLGGSTKDTLSWMTALLWQLSWATRCLAAFPGRARTWCLLWSWCMTPGFCVSEVNTVLWFHSAGTRSCWNDKEEHRRHFSQYQSCDRMIWVRRL